MKGLSLVGMIGKAQFLYRGKRLLIEPVVLRTFQVDCHRALIVPPFFVYSCRITAKEPIRTIPSTAHMRSRLLTHKRKLLLHNICALGQRIVKVYDPRKLGALANLFFTSFSSYLVYRLHVVCNPLSLSCCYRMKEMVWMEMS